MVKDTFGFIYRLIITTIVVLGISVISLSFVVDVEGHRMHAVRFYVVNHTVEPVETHFLTTSIVMRDGSVGLPNVTEANRPQGMPTEYVFIGWYEDYNFSIPFVASQVGDIREVFGRFGPGHIIL